LSNRVGPHVPVRTRRAIEWVKGPSFEKFGLEFSLNEAAAKEQKRC
jgi:hypothetical protein